jgi:hypothetical protein
MRRWTGTGRGWLRTTRGATALAVATAVLITTGGAGAVPSRPHEIHERAMIDRLQPCRWLKRPRCGSNVVPLDRRDPSMGDISIGFEVYPRRDLTNANVFARLC